MVHVLVCFVTLRRSCIIGQVVTFPGAKRRANWGCCPVIRAESVMTGRGSDDVCSAQERSKRQLLASGAELADAELELMWNWNIHVRKNPILANSQARPPA